MLTLCLVFPHRYTVLSPAPCDPAHPEADPSELFDAKLLSAWSKQEIDFDSPMFPSNGPFLRHVLVSTGKRDWPHDIASVQGTLAELYSKWAEEEPKNVAASTAMDGDGSDGEVGPTLPAGCWRTSPGAPDRPSRLLIGNSSQVSTSHHSHGQSVMLLPDYEVLCDVQDATDSASSSTSSATTAARNAYDAYVSPSASSPSSSSSSDAAASSTSASLRAARKDGVRRYVLPYKAIVVLCSHKKRDARCGISAPLLADVFRRHAEAAGWEVDERGDDVGHHHSPSMKGDVEEDGDESSLQWSEEGLVTNRGWGYVHDSPSPAEHSPDEQSRLWRKTLHFSSPSSSSSSSPSTPGSTLPSPPAPTLGIFHTSHIGKHKFAGNVMVYLPNRAGVWYGRVDPLGGGAGQVWEQTILKGRIIPEFLRLGINLWRGGGVGADAEGEEGAADEETEQKRVSGSVGELKAAAGEQPGILRW